MAHTLGRFSPKRPDRPSVQHRLQDRKQKPAEMKIFFGVAYQPGEVSREAQIAQPDSDRFRGCSLGRREWLRHSLSLAGTKLSGDGLRIMPSSLRQIHKRMDTPSAAYISFCAPLSRTR